ncbi:MAG: DedA family protein [Desulfobacterales bacterium]|nr:MAG: DedA family protein [Desulfobacterales bacterium]
MTLENFIATYGYAAIWLGTFLEGETILILGGFMAHQGYLVLPGVILAAFGGTLCGDQLYFYLGRTHSRYLLNRRPSWQPRITKAQRLLERFHTPIILGFRFLYGLRTVASFAIGMSPVSAGRFVVLNGVGAAIWAVTVGGGGYLCGQALAFVIDDIKRYELQVLAGIAALGLFIWIVHIYRRKKRP